MDRWGIICVMISNILVIIREIIKLKTTNVDVKFYRIFTVLATVFISLGIILYCFM